MIQLDADLDRIGELSHSHGNAETAKTLQQLQRQAAKLRARRELIATFIGKESDR